jgi:hypothetical protein
VQSLGQNWPHFTAMAIALCAGCSGTQGPATFPVSGTVTLNGQPLEGANVTFHPLDERQNTMASQAVTDAAGRFQLSTHIGGGRFKNGIAAGKYAVAINKLDTAAIKTTMSPPKNVLPGQYNDPATSGFTADVVAGQENEFPFALVDK